MSSAKQDARDAGELALDEALKAILSAQQLLSVANGCGNPRVPGIVAHGAQQELEKVKRQLAGKPVAVSPTSKDHVWHFVGHNRKTWESAWEELGGNVLDVVESHSEEQQVLIIYAFRKPA